MMTAKRARFRSSGIILLAASLWFAPFLISGHRIAPTPPVLSSPTFKLRGQIPGEIQGPPDGSAYWSSWCGNDTNTGRLEVGPFPAPEALLFYLRGYPTKPGNQVYLDNLQTGERLYLARVDAGEVWSRWVWVLPGSWRGSKVRLTGVDDAQEWGGWFAISELRSLPGFLSRWFGFWEQLHDFMTVGLLVLFVEEAYRKGLVSRLGLPRFGEVAVALVCAAATGYAVSIIAFVSPVAARVAIATVFIAALVALARPRPGPDAAKVPATASREALLIVLLTSAIGAVYFSLLLSYSPNSNVLALSGTRYFDGMVSDNQIPEFYAHQLWTGGDARAKFGDWLSSDRPPLQAGWVLLFGAPFSVLNGDFSSCAQYAGIWFQLLWVAAGWGWLRAVGMERRGAVAVMVAVAATGLFAFNSVYVWPKMAAGALLLVGYTLLFEMKISKKNALLGGASVGLSFLAHGGVAFALLGLIPFMFFSARQRGRAFWGCAAAGSAVMVFPWFCYQKFLDPPGNRLLKWHLAGQVHPDARGFLETLLSSYRHMSWSRWLQVREINYQTMTSGCSFRALAFGGSLFGRRVDESFYFLPSLGWWAPAAVLVLAAMILGRCRSYWPSVCRALLWIALTLVLWGALMFIPGSTFNHQGTFVCQLVVMLALGSALWRLWRFGFWLVAALQVIAFVRVWIPPTPAAEARIFQLGPMFILALSLAVLLWLFRLAGGPEPGDR